MSEPEQWPELDPTVRILAHTDVGDVWDRFEVFHALHHNMQICNPMSSGQVDDAVDALGLASGMHVYDAACGFGEILIRCAVADRVTGTGIDLSPWMVQGAVQQARERTPDADVGWVLGEARDFELPQLVDVAVCSGAEWVWHDLAGTVRALNARVRSGGVIAIGGARLHLDADQAAVRGSHGRIESVSDIERMLDEAGFSLRTRLDPDDGDWDCYLERTRSASAMWEAQHPGSRARQWRVEQQDWHIARERDRGIIGWSLWVAEKRS